MNHAQPAAEGAGILQERIPRVALTAVPGSCRWIPKAQHPPRAHRLRAEFREHDARGSHPERAQQLIDHPVDVVQRQHVQDHILLLPLPFLNQPRGLQMKTNSVALGQEERFSRGIQAPNSPAGILGLPGHKIFPLGSA